MKNQASKENVRKNSDPAKAYSLKNGGYLDVSIIHGKGMNFLGNTFKG